MAVTYYTGQRISFRPLEVEDESLLRRWINDPRIWSTVHMRPPTNAVREREWIEQQGKSETDYTFGIVAQEGQRLIGACGLHNLSVRAHSATLGIMIGETQLHDQGYGTEAMRLLLRFGFEELNLHRVELTVFDHNPRAIHVYEKVGFVLEGRARQAAFRHGRYHDLLRYGILRPEWGATAIRTPATAQAQGELAAVGATTG